MSGYATPSINLCDAVSTPTVDLCAGDILSAAAAAAGAATVLGVSPTLGPIVLDTFSTDGTLATRNGEVGATWSTSPYWTNDKPTSSGTVSGGYLYVPGSGGFTSTTYFASGVTPGGNDYYTEIEFVVPSGYSGTPQAEIVWTTNPSAPTVEYVDLYLEPRPGNGDWAVGWTTKINGSTQNQGTSFVSTFAVDTVKTLKLTVTNGGKTFTVYLDGAQVDTATFATAFDVFYTGVAFYNASNLFARTGNILRVITDYL